ncbi:Uncharacterized protein Adt_35320 [Abeliophyllum distichum]|uniref:Retrotransposon gag domain-containing protein n=1 Tax=Abeliophyllum distichum TaxID=126358 RepID=A0ABD1QFA9_9LAMI
MRQGKSKSLKSYSAQFTEEMHTCKNITEAEKFSVLKLGLDMSSMLRRDVRSMKPRDYNALVDLMKEEIISEEMDSHTQQCYNHGEQANTKLLDGRACHQAEHRQECHSRLFPRTGSSYAAKITKAIPNLQLVLNVLNQGVSVGEAGSIKSKEPFTRPYCTYHEFYGRGQRIA